jgi:hypothetical protein
MDRIEERVQRAVINLFYARAEIVTPADTQALVRALDHITKACDELMPEALQFEMFSETASQIKPT